MKIVSFNKDSSEIGWAWCFNGSLCRWAEPTKEQLLKTQKPTPEAKPVPVIIIRKKDCFKI